MHTQLFNRFSRLSLFLVLSLSMAACGGGGSSSSPSSNNAIPVTPAANTAPVASDANVSLSPGATVTSTLIAKDAESSTLTYGIVSSPSDGTLSLDDPSTGAYTYINTGNASSDSFTFKANDGTLDSNIATVSITTVAPDAPASGLTATAGDESNKLNWDAVAGADSYNIYRSDTPGAGIGGSKIVSGIKPPFYDNGLTNGTTYYYVVTAVNKVGESAASSEVSATPADILISSLSFGDSNLQTCVTGFGKTYVHDLTYLNCASAGISDLSGIDALTSLTELVLESNSISDLDPLAGLTNLTILYLYYNNIIDLSPLAGLTNLTILHLAGNSISNLNPLAGLTSLTTLVLAGNNSISDVSPLAGLTSLTTLSLDFDSISDVSPLASLTSLTTLTFSNNNIIDVSPLANLTHLTFLGLEANDIGGQGVGHVDTLTSLTSATVIYLGSNVGMSCNELSSLISALGSPPADTDGNTSNTDTAQNGVNCTNP